MSVQEIISEVSIRISVQELVVNVDVVVDDFCECIDIVSFVDQVKVICVDIELQKVLLGIVLFIELKNKVVKCYYQVDVQNKVEVVINLILNSGELEVVEMFVKVESMFGVVKCYFGDELYDKYCVILDDMKLEYIG